MPGGCGGKRTAYYTVGRKQIGVATGKSMEVSYKAKNRVTIQQ